MAHLCCFLKTYARAKRKKTRMANTRKAAQGMSDSSEKTRPMVPAVDGMIMNMPDTIASIAAARGNSGLRSMTNAKISNAAAFRT